MLRLVVDTNLWIRVLLGGPVTLPILEAWQARRFTVVVSQPLADEELRTAMKQYGVRLWGVNGLLERTRVEQDE